MNPDLPHAYKKRTLTNNNNAPGASVTVRFVRNNHPCDVCGGSDQLQIHVVSPQSRNYFPLFAGTPFSRSDR